VFSGDFAKTVGRFFRFSGDFANPDARRVELSTKIL
jgi:hypothetical protein